MSMRDLGTAEVLGAEAIGQPGQRRFRLFARTRAFTAILWVEKQQLLELALVIDRFLAQISEGNILRIEAQVEIRHNANKNLPDNFPLPSDYDFQVGQLRLNFDAEHITFVLVAVPFEVVENEHGELEPSLQTDDALSFQFNVEQAQDLTGRISFLERGGRPVCPLCHTPLDGGPHSCVKQNGHREIIQIVRDEDES
ncbi:MAG TPA: DUF3090 family protein [Ktedonobacteraceae bacterium]